MASIFVQSNRGDRISKGLIFEEFQPLVSIPVGRETKTIIDDAYRYNTNPVTPVQYSIHRMERKERYITHKRYDKLKPMFLNAKKEVVERALEATTQHGKTILATNSIKNALKSRFPANNVRRRHESVCTDMVHSDTPALGSGGLKNAQVYVGRSSLVADAYLFGSAAEFVNTLTDNIRRRGAMDTLISDGHKAQISTRVKEVLRALVIADWQSEPHQPQQHFFERWYQTIKRLVKAILDWSGANPQEWFLVLSYVIYIRNRTAVKSLGWITPLEKLTGQTPDISIMLLMPYRQPVFFKEVDGSGRKLEAQG